ncbi:hypothetical protein RJ639_043806 [Escallonia herrerae]|uniref:HAT C-terminal dimerisation domain-containing protein n=1 Tax=Escallonia herrerae TaxID=1293975 RepID=A0AA88WD23_9ASTE|nr:hypothetical protein RJ639_043806 [Escallonia herrerae]
MDVPSRVSFNAVKLRSFAQALEVVGHYGVGLSPSTYHEVNSYKNARDLSGKGSAIRLRSKKHPTEWWDTFGNGTPELKRMALHILGLCCTSSPDDRKWVDFEHYNQRLRERFLIRQSSRGAYDAISYDKVNESSEWLTGLVPAEDKFHFLGNLRWSEVNSQFEESGNKIRDRYAIFDDNETQTPDPESCKEFDDDENQPPDPESCKEAEAEAEFAELNQDNDIEEDFSYGESGAELVFATAGDGLAGAQLLDEDLNFIPLDDLVYDCF